MLGFIVMVCIILNIVTMAMSYETAPTSYNDMLDWINLGFTVVFIFECAMKLVGYGFKGYFLNGWNQFDFCVVATSILDLALTYSGKSFIKFLKVGPQLGRIFRVLRVSRLLRLIKSFEGLQKLIQVAIYTIPQLMNVVALLFIVLFIFAVLGVFLFKSVT